MLRIIKHGSTKPKVYKCICHDCDCVFVTDDVKIRSIGEYCCVYHYALCPCCGNKEVIDVHMVDDE